LLAAGSVLGGGAYLLRNLAKAPTDAVSKVEIPPLSGSPALAAGAPPLSMNVGPPGYSPEGVAPPAGGAVAMGPPPAWSPSTPQNSPGTNDPNGDNNNDDDGDNDDDDDDDEEDCPVAEKTNPTITFSISCSETVSTTQSASGCTTIGTDSTSGQYRSHVLIVLLQERRHSLQTRQ